MVARVPVFVSVPTQLATHQQHSYDIITAMLADEALEARTLGRTDFAVDYPLKEVLSIARHCAGGLILGFEYALADQLILRRDTSRQASRLNYPMPTPWNQLEAGILVGLRLPIMVFCEQGIEGGIFDRGTSEVFVQTIPADPATLGHDGVRLAIKTWASRVRENYRA